MNCCAKDEADVLKKAKKLYVLDDGSYDKEYNNLSSRLALNNDYDGKSMVLKDVNGLKWV